MNPLFIHGFISSELTQVICRTLLHSVWQGLLAAAVSGIIIIGTKKTKASARYNLLSFVFICFILTSVITFLNQFNNTATPASTIEPHVSSNANYITVNANDDWLPVIETDKFYQPVIYYADQHAALISGVWLFFFLIQMVRMSAGLHYANVLKRKHIISPPEEWQVQLQQLAKSLGIRRIVSLMESGLVKVPAVIGIFKPVILVPLGMLTKLSLCQVETVLLHELAHVRRRDFAMNILQRVAEAFFFFNPFVMWLSARIREEREACCDDIVMQHVNDKRSYLEALISFRHADTLSFGYTVTLGHKNNLLYRVKRMITQENKKLNAMEKLTLIFVLMAAMAISFMPARKIKPAREKLTENTQQLPQQPESRMEPKHLPARSKKLIRTPSGDTTPNVKIERFKSISATVNDDGSTKKADVTAIATDGTIYRYRSLNDKLIELAVNGKQIKEEDFDRYDGIIDQVEAQRKENNQKRLLDLEHQALLEKRDLLNKQSLNFQNKADLLKENDRARLLKKQQMAKDNLLALSLQLEKLKLQQENSLALNRNNDNLLKEKLLLHDKARHDETEKMMPNQLSELNSANEKNEILAAQDEKFHESNYQLASILAELAEAGVITDKHDFSITLNNDELIVNGKKQSAELFEPLRKKYIKHKNDYFKYKAKQNSRSTDIHVE